MSPRAPAVPSRHTAGPEAEVAVAATCAGMAGMAGALEPHMETLRRELLAPDPAVLSVLLALIAVAITIRESRPAGEPLPSAPRCWAAGGGGGLRRSPLSPQCSGGSCRAGEAAGGRCCCWGSATRGRRCCSPG